MLLKTYNSLPTLNFGMLVGFIISERNTNIFCDQINRSLGILETMVGPCVLGSICLQLGQMRTT